ncbi:hypothetical protein DOTSEDRAFT_26507 [Dothistroma septosporum NZE10]|uniref:Uncharacterized protein n=1 Tax=Dothistroma septosporum (strain NZE10 / CBS 128990) TaxID=675120 RepID=N1PIG1_DOTSN|nr:hypothetical protein DOTSEDRAFT_26507 [Dothistroma septosporum NZE10]
MSYHLSREQEDAAYRKEVRMHGTMAKCRYSALSLLPAPDSTWISGLIFRTRFHTARDWQTLHIHVSGDEARSAVQGLLEQVIPQGTEAVWVVHNDGAEFPVVDFEDVLVWIQERSVVGRGSEVVMDTVVYDYDPTEGRVAERFEADEKTKEKMRRKDGNGRKFKCGVM